MTAESPYPEDKVAHVRKVCRAEPRLAALYAFGQRRQTELDFAALFTERIAWPERLDLELVVARALELDWVELIDMRRMPLIFRYWVLNRGEPLYVGRPEMLAVFIEETVARYSSFYPLLEALYWKVETGPLAEDML